MPLDAETIARLTQPKPKRAPANVKNGTGGVVKRHKQIRVATQYPELEKNAFVGTTGERSLPCTSFGCGAPSCFTYMGAPMCNIHIVYQLVYELQRVGAVPIDSQEFGENDSYL